MRKRRVKEVSQALAGDARWLPCAEVARLVGVSRQAIHDRCQRGTLESQPALFGRGREVRVCDAVKEFSAGRPVLKPFDALEVSRVLNPDAVSVLFARPDSIYKEMGVSDVWDIDRDAMRFRGKSPVVAHPPCRAWGKVRGLAKPRAGEKDCARFALSVVRKNGGVLEHPVGSLLWRENDLPFPGEFCDQFGGFSVFVDQFNFGHVAHKPTWIYVCGIDPRTLPPMPKPVKGKPAARAIFSAEGKKTCTQYMREYTPPDFAAWLYETASKASN